MAELRGGIAGAAAGLGILLPLSLLAFAAFGPQAVPHAVRAAFAAAIVGTLVSALVGGSALQGSMPRTTTTLIFAGLVASLAGEGLDLGTVVVLTTACTLMAGLTQVAFGLMRAGTVARYVPLPVVAGYIDGIALLIILGQLPALLGVVEGGASVWTALQNLHVGALVLGIVTIVIVEYVNRRHSHWPALLAGLASGTLLYAGVHLFFASADMGPLLGAPHAELPWPNGWLPLLRWPWPESMLAYLPRVAVTAVVIAVIGSLDTLLTAAAVENVIGLAYSPNRLLVAQGMATVASSAFAGLPTVYSGAIVMGNHRAGGRTRLSTIFTSLLLLCLLLYGSQLIGLVPHAVSAAVMICVAFLLFDRWTSRVARRALRRGGIPDLRYNLAIVLAVCVVTVLLNFVISLMVGFVLAMILFVTGLNRSLVRSVASGSTRSSRRIYPLEQASVLCEQGDHVKLVTLEGAIFFGTAETLHREVSLLAATARHVILDLRRVTTIDASGAMVIARLTSVLKVAGTELLLSNIVPGDRHAQALHAFADGGEPDETLWFADSDLALERAELRTLASAGATFFDTELPRDQLPLLDGLAPADTVRVAALLKRLELPAGAVLFRRGDLGDRLYMLARGSVTLGEGAGPQAESGRRIVSFKTGVVFGETAMLDGGARTASAVTDSECVVYTLSGVDLDRLRTDAPTLAAQLLFNVAKQLSGRLRFATMVLWANDEDRH